mgnify:CR=1 FL=1
MRGPQWVGLWVVPGGLGWRVWVGAVGGEWHWEGLVVVCASAQVELGYAAPSPCCCLLLFPPSHTNAAAFPKVCYSCYALKTLNAIAVVLCRSACQALVGCCC